MHTQELAALFGSGLLLAQPTLMLVNINKR